MVPQRGTLVTSGFLSLSPSAQGGNEAGAEGETKQLQFSLLSLMSLNDNAECLLWLGCGLCSQRPCDGSLSPGSGGGEVTGCCPWIGRD